MNIKIIPKPLKGSISAIASKSHAHRLLIASALCDDPCHVEISHMNQDIEATLNCLSQLGNSTPEFNCGESGSTLRFLLPLAMALKSEAAFFGAGRLPQRPISPLKEEMEKHGCVFSDMDSDSHSSEGCICRISGRLTGGTFNLSGNISSQYITGLLFALPLLDEDSTLHITSRLESIGYVMLTLEVLKLFGIAVEVDKKDFYTFFIRGRQKYVSPKAVAAEGDWSNGAFWLVSDMLSRFICSSEGRIAPPRVLCTNLRKDSSQGDKAILDFLEILISAEPSETLTFDAADVPDLVPVLAAAACGRKGTTNIINAARLRIKESDRLSTVNEILKELGADITELKDGLIIRGTGFLKGGCINGHNDHRIVMTGAVASIICSNPVCIYGAEAVNKSYPDFFEHFAALGGEYYVIQ